MKYPGNHAELQPLLERIREEVGAGRLALPLTGTNIYETQKVNNLERRQDLAFVQATFSRGLVIRGRQKRITVELAAALANCCQIAAPARDKHWFLSNLFFEAFTEWDDERLGFKISEKVVSLVRESPAERLYEYLVGTPDDVRLAAVKNFSDGSKRLRMNIEDRRARHANETMSMRRRIYSALLMIGEIERVIKLANSMGIPWQGAQDMGPTVAQRLMEEVPTFYIEREMVLRLEAQARSTVENDFRDMQSFCAVIPYMNMVIGENQFVNLARQSRLDKKFDVELATDILALADVLKARSR